MSDNNNNEEVTQEVTDQVTDQVTDKVDGDPTFEATVNNEKKTISVDLWGVPVELEVDKAKELIAKRDERSSVFRDLSDKVKTFENEAKEAKRKAEALEAARKGDVAEAEQLFNKKLEDTVSRYKSKVVDAELTSALLNNESFLDTPSNRSDALALIKAQNNFDLDDDNNIKSGDKAIKDIVNDFIANRDAFKKANTTRKPSAQPQGVPVKEKVSFAEAAKQHISRLANG